MTTTSVASDAERPADQPQPDPPAIVKAPEPPRLRWRVVVRTGDSDFIVDVSAVSLPPVSGARYRWNLLASGAGTGIEATHSPRFASKVQSILAGLTPALFDGH
jgi:hypothetical protein